MQAGDFVCLTSGSPKMVVTIPVVPGREDLCEVAYYDPNTGAMTANIKIVALKEWTAEDGNCPDGKHSFISQYTDQVVGDEKNPVIQKACLGVICTQCGKSIGRAELFKKIE